MEEGRPWALRRRDKLLSLGGRRPCLENAELSSQWTRSCAVNLNHPTVRTGSELSPEAL